MSKTKNRLGELAPTLRDNSISKFADIGKVLNDWEIKELNYFLDYIQPTEFLAISIAEVQTKTNVIPVLTAGKSFVLGYAENDNRTFRDVPVVIFDDFTTDNKYVDFSFQLRSSAAKILIPKAIDFDLKFVFYAMQLLKFISSDHKRYWISEYQFLLIPNPPIKEQKRITEIINTWDTAISTCQQLLDGLLKRKQSIAFELLFSGTKKRQTTLVKTAPLSRVLKRIKNPVIVDDEAQYQQIGIRSHTKGIFYKEMVTGKSLGNKSVFKIEPDCFIVNIVFAWEHAIAKTTVNEVGMIASHRFPMYKPVEGELDLNYLLHFFKSSKGKDLLALASPGGAGRNKTLGQNDFLKIQIPVPKIDVQRTIAGCLDMVDEEISVYKRKLSALQGQKKGLMQQLLTGKVRVKIK